MPYQNTQAGVVSVGVLSAVAAFIWMASRVSGDAPIAALVPPMAIIAALVVLLSTLTVRVTAVGIEWWLSFGLLKRSLRFEEITAARAREIFPLAFGIHWDLRGGMSYIVTGGSALELFLKNGKRVTMSCADPHKIIEMLKQHSVKAAI